MNYRRYWKDRFPERPYGVTDEEWAIFGLCVRDGKTRKAIAESLGVSVDRVSSALSRVSIRSLPQVRADRCPCCNGTGRAQTTKTEEPPADVIR